MRSGQGPPPDGWLGSRSAPETERRPPCRRPDRRPPGSHSHTHAAPLGSVACVLTLPPPLSARHPRTRDSELPTVCSPQTLRHTRRQTSSLFCFWCSVCVAHAGGPGHLRCVLYGVSPLPAPCAPAPVGQKTAGTPGASRCPFRPPPPPAHPVIPPSSPGRCLPQGVGDSGSDGLLFGEGSVAQQHVWGLTTLPPGGGLRAGSGGHPRAPSAPAAQSRAGLPSGSARGACSCRPQPWVPGVPCVGREQGVFVVPSADRFYGESAPLGVKSCFTLLCFSSFWFPSWHFSYFVLG